MNQSQKKGKDKNSRKENNGILIVDDEMVVRNSIKRMISSICKELDLHFKIVEGSDGKDILDHLKVTTDEAKESPEPADIKFKLLFTDEEMGNLNGSTAIKEIRKREEEKNTKSLKKKSIVIVSITSNAQFDTARMIKESGADYVIQKPPKKCQIKELVINTLIN
jgi:CheY-like chemotaxis protein